ncbi:hypothetical protein CC2G_014328 [Coprinopsis cinerea AmutBmut pab1-1]|nr:hypothetical protein CC2G_014328 [Coprinopsis cinerea AmutBmut pab1-1]
MARKSSTPKLPPNAAIYPLTFMDMPAALASMVKAWIVEGIVETEKIREALDRVVEKWPTMAGRVEMIGKRRYLVHVPTALSDLPEDYETYCVTSRTSTVPLSRFIELPLGTFSPCPPVSLFIPDDGRHKLGSLADYAKNGTPITHWHFTYFPPGPENGELGYTCIGVTYSHGLFDAVGNSMFLHALDAELNGKEWTVPWYPSTPGLHPNPLQEILDEELEKLLEDKERNEALDALLPWTEAGSKPGAPATSRSGFPEDLRRYPPPMKIVNLLQIIVWLIGLFIQKWVYGASTTHVVLPRDIHTRLANETRKEAEDNGLTDTRISGGDVVLAWLLQSLYKDDPNRNRTVSLGNVASIRSTYPAKLSNYPHNSVTSISYPIFTTSPSPSPYLHSLSSQPLYQIAYTLAKTRATTSRVDDFLISYKTSQIVDAQWLGGLALPVTERTDETMLMTNASIARIAFLGWTPAMKGGKGGRTLTHYRLSPSPIPVVNILFTNGWLENGDLVLNISVTKDKMDRVKAEFGKLVERYGKGGDS